MQIKKKKQTIQQPTNRPFQRDNETIEKKEKSEKV